MVQVVGVRFRSSGKVYYFDPAGFTMRAGSHVIVETSRGLEYGTVVGPMREIDEEKLQQPLKAVIRVASEEDEERAASNRTREREAIAICKEKILSRGLDMKLIDAEYTFDNSKVLFYFTADGRIDFRELVKDLASIFRTRIELRQIGVRDETKILGGIGICGRPLCCHTYLTDFTPVSIRMAKEQNLSLNPTKISGVCGRLMCCLKNEEDTYEYLNSKLPSVGSSVMTPTGLQGIVTSVNVLRQTVKVMVEENDEKEVHEYAVADLKFHSRKHRGGKHEEAPQQNTEPEEAVLSEELKGLEEEEMSPDAEAAKEAAKENENAERGGRLEGGRNRNRGSRRDRGERPERNDRENTAENKEQSDNENAVRRGRGEKEAYERRERPEKGGHGEGRNRRDRHERERHGREGSEGRHSEGKPQETNNQEGRSSEGRGENKRTRSSRRFRGRGGNHGGAEGSQEGARRSSEEK